MRKLAYLILLALTGCTVFNPTHGIPNLYVTSFGYRGGQPTAKGWKWLKAQGITDCVKLNTDKEATDYDGEVLGIIIHPMPITPIEQIDPFQEKQVLLKITAAVQVMKTSRCFVHCGSIKRTGSWIDKQLDIQGGQDRTGLACAAYRVWVDHWTKDRARAEMLKIGFHPSLIGLNGVWEKLH